MTRIYDCIVDSSSVPGVFLLRAECYICDILNNVESLTIKFELEIFQNINTASDPGG